MTSHVIHNQCIATNARMETIRSLQTYGNFADMISECNVGEDAFSGYGEWFYIPDDPLRKQ